MADLRILRTDVVICQMTEVTFKEWVFWNDEDSTDSHYLFTGKGWSPPFDPVSGDREYFLEVRWDEVTKIISDPDFDLFHDNLQLVTKALVENKDQIMDNRMVAWKSHSQGFEGSPTSLLFGAEAAPDHPMGETCIWCEHDTAIEIEEAWHDPNYDKEADTNWTAYKCSTCGCEFVMGTKCTAFNDITKKGKPELSVDMPE